jgi:geranylgeranyldiphosphate transferase
MGSQILSNLILNDTLTVQLFLPSMLFAYAMVVSFYLVKAQRSLTERYLFGKKHPATITSHECPYSYIRQIYGHHHWAPFVERMSPNLHKDNPKKYEIVHEIMDAVHLCLILVDDVRLLLERLMKVEPQKY